MASASAFLSSSFTFSAYQTLKTSSVCFNLHQFGHSVSRNKASDFIFIPLVSITGRHSTVWRNRTTLHASAYALNAVASAAPESPEDPDHIPMSIVVIVQDFDCDVTIVKLSFGDCLGALIDTMEKLVDFGLAVLKGALFTEGSDMQTEFAIKILETGNKVEDPDMLDRLRLSIINNLLKYHPESSEQLAMGEVLGVKAPKMKILVDITAVLNLYEDGPFRSLFYIEKGDRPGSLLEIIEMIGHLNFDVKSAEIVSEGFLTKLKFHVSYNGQLLDITLGL